MPIATPTAKSFDITVNRGNIIFGFFTEFAADF
jgi:hypothetical protein